MTGRIQFRRDTAANWTSANPVLGQGEPAVETDTGFSKIGDGSSVWSALPYQAPNATSLAATYTTQAAALQAWTLVQAFTVTSAARDSNEAITTASVVWPDGATGTFTTDTASTSFPGAVDAYHVTHVLGGVTKTVTQAAVTRDAGGAVIAQPELVVA